MDAIAKQIMKDNQIIDITDSSLKIVILLSIDKHHQIRDITNILSVTENAAKAMSIVSCATSLVPLNE